MAINWKDYLNGATSPEDLKDREAKVLQAVNNLTAELCFVCWNSTHKKETDWGTNITANNFFLCSVECYKILRDGVGNPLNGNPIKINHPNWKAGIGNGWKSAPYSTTPPPTGDLDQILYNGLAKIFDEWMGFQKKKEQETPADKEVQKEAEIKAEFDLLTKQGIIPFHWGREIEKLDEKGEPIYKTGTGYLVNDLDSYKRYLKDLNNLLDSDYELPPYRFPNGRIIQTYEQFKLVAVNTISTDFLRGKKLTYLATFVEEFFQREPSGQIGRHLRELFSQMEFDLKLYHPNFWKRIEKYLKKIELPPTPPELPQDIKIWLDRVSDFIDFSYAPFPKPYNYSLYLRDKLAILNDLEILLREVYQKFLANPQNFLKLTSNKLLTTTFTNQNWGENTSRQKGTSKEKFLEKRSEMDSFEQPLKGYEAENNKEWWRFKALIFKNQGVENIKDKLVFDKATDKETGGRQGRRGETKTISREIDPRVEAKLLEVVANLVDRFVIYKNIGAILDKHFWTIGEILFRNKEEYGEVEYEDEY